MLSVTLQPLVASLWDMAGWQCPTRNSTGWCTGPHQSPSFLRH